MYAHYHLQRCVVGDLETYSSQVVVVAQHVGELVCFAYSSLNLLPLDSALLSFVALFLQHHPNLHVGGGGVG